MATSASSTMATKTLVLRNPNFKQSYPTRSNRIITHSWINCPRISLYNNISRSKFPSNLTHSIPKFRVSASSSSTTSPILPTSSPKTNSIISDSTRSITSIFAVVLSLSKLFGNAIQGVLKKVSLTPTPEELGKLQNLKESLVCTIGPLFFAAVRERPRGYLNTPLTVVASGAYSTNSVMFSL
ncbi:hypothetical protein C5167_009215 [Papaver somniferum]|uniref:Uncharacterized protein n=1 Tax=Papaver somniferum TaxID=3469 RepID=A0A4Y7JZN1_PAPSO|nr:hypothetical protein C5167_009215 [Papaver somniferum]